MIEETTVDIEKDCHVAKSNFGALVFIVVLALGLAMAAGLYFFTSSSGFVTVVVPAKDLPANHLINASDLASREIFAFYLQDDVIRNSSYAINNYTKIPFKKDNPFTLGDITPDATSPGTGSSVPSTIVLPPGGLVITSS